VNKSHGPWELMNWISRYKLPAIEAIKHNDRLYLSPESLWNTLHSTFNTALNHQVDLNILSIKIEESGLDLFYFSFYFLFSFQFIFNFQILEQLGLGLIGHIITSVT